MSLLTVYAAEIDHARRLAEATHAAQQATALPLPVRTPGRWQGWLRRLALATMLVRPAPAAPSAESATIPGEAVARSQ
jgi:hypothetical protein